MPRAVAENGRWYLVFSRFSEEVGTIYRVADSPRGPFRVPAREDLGGRRWYAAKSAPQPDGSRVFFGWLHDFVTEGDRPRWLWGGDFAAPRVVTADPSGDLKVTLHPAVASWFAEAENDRIALAGVGGEAHSALGPVLPATARVTAEFSLPQSPQPWDSPWLATPISKAGSLPSIANGSGLALSGTCARSTIFGGRQPADPARIGKSTGRLSPKRRSMATATAIA